MFKCFFKKMVDKMVVMMIDRVFRGVIRMVLVKVYVVKLSFLFKIIRIMFVY